ncbi:unnamed protein product [Ranitomeya imitator]|uniref:Reverse transcriptase domain-containing protein n=1 Tax=Ranitomeya imitator TaxID=111125 RepID=A0ABN9MHZ3_9NEOB|nr:unnamed protein product [Ranitomeya imitator]
MRYATFAPKSRFNDAKSAISQPMKNLEDLLRKKVLSRESGKSERDGHAVRNRDNTNILPRDDPNFDRLFKIRPVIEHFSNKFAEVNIPQREICVDESLIHFIGRLQFSSVSTCPAKRARWDSFQLEKGLQSFYRSIRLKVHFEDNPYSTSNTPGTVPDRDGGPLITLDQLGLRNPSKFMPPKTNHAMETFITLLDRDIKETILDQRLGFLPVRHNLTPLEKQALASLKDNSHIVIKPADKGGATVVMNKNQYIAEIKRQLADTTTYRKIQSDPVYSIWKKINTILTKHSQLQTIDAKTKTFLTNDHLITPVLYILPKIHKNLLNPPGRPIVASTDSILNPISIYLEKLLTPYTHKTKSFILDTSDFLKKIQEINTVPVNSILCTLDVNSLYTSITHDTGIEAVSLKLLEASVDTLSQDLCLELLNLVLRENYFLFEDDFYVQICGTAMGSNVAPAYANLYMDRFERDFVYPNTLFQQYALLWYRYIDDIFCIWQSDHTSLTTFYNTINEIRPELKLSISHHMEAITFLDTKVCKDVHGSLTTDIYTKPTDRNNLLLYNSCHPKSTRNSLPQSQFKRVSRIVSNPTVRQSRLHEMSKKFEDREYPCTLLNTEMIKAMSEIDPIPTPLPKPSRLPFALAPALERPAMMSRSSDRDVITGPALIPTLGPEAAVDYKGPLGKSGCSNPEHVHPGVVVVVDDEDEEKEEDDTK